MQTREGVKDDPHVMGLGAEEMPEFQLRRRHQRRRLRCGELGLGVTSEEMAAETACAKEITQGKGLKGAEDKDPPR